MGSIDRAGRRLVAIGAGILLVAISAAPALACGGLIGPNGAVNLLRTTTLAAYHGGEEHYHATPFRGGIQSSAPNALRKNDVQTPASR